MTITCFQFLKQENIIKFRAACKTFEETITRSQ